MATLKQIRQRIRASKNIRQITRAMKLVAAARLTRAKNKVEEARPYSGKMREFMTSVSAGGSLPSHPLLERREVKKIVLVLITAERGLCGSYNAALIRKTEDWLKEQTVPVSLVTVGKKGNLYFGKRGYPSITTFTVPTAGAGLDDAVAVTEKVKELFTSGEADAIYLCFSRFFSPIRQEPRITQLLPIEPPEVEEGAAGADKDYDFEPSPKELLGLLLPKYVLTLVLQSMLEASASEHGARMTAMSNATDSAGKMINELTLQANRSRQAGITKEILEIVGGAEALKA